MKVKTETVLWMLIISSTIFLFSIYFSLVVTFQMKYIEFYKVNDMVDNAEVIVVEKEVPNKEIKSSDFKVTHYCGCSKCCGKWSDGYEDIAYGSTGKLLTPFVSIAVDPKVIPYGTILWDDEGNEYIAEDCGGVIKGNRIDLFVGNHNKALELGVIQNKTFYWEDKTDEGNRQSY